ncbi:transcription factor Tfb2 [Saccharata proteae CBS 121410]|uniref:RNA polymerase II transcription factor B subunit 2 n=1 Tax=Saccharata proteae CBS 121410 TaxID=1314787 RepID=A0A9P4LSY0_9PEZI|nr:transcription factor Tfb2 [Saccharata proteae CBS 121410]
MSASASTQALEYLEGQQGTTHRRLYQQPSTVLAVFRRMLPHLAKSIVMAMLYMNGPFPISDLDVWVTPQSKPDKDKALAVLESLHIIIQDRETPNLPAYRLSAGFQNSLRQALTGGGNHKSFGVPCNTSDREKKTVGFLDSYARKQWEAILYYMVGSTGSGLTGRQDISHGTKTLLNLGRFVEMKRGRPEITTTGFSFLLQEVNGQVWSLLIVYLEQAGGLNMDSVDVLSFLFMLGSLELGQDYSTANLSPTQQHMLEDLSDFGLVYRSTPTSTRFYPTRLATTLTSDAPALISTSALSAAPTSLPNAGPTTASKGYIIVETNYRIYAYTTSELQIAVLALFARLTIRFPNLVAGKLTKRSIQRAISHGITADQIVRYLDTYAHPQMQRSSHGNSANAGAVLPPTVVDQIRLWQIEGDRMTATDGFLMKDFKDFNEFTDIRDYADAIGVLAWASEAKRLIFLTRVEQISQFVKNRNKK